MFKKKHHKRYVNSYFKPVTSMKVNKIINQVIPNAPKNSGLSDSEGLTRAYNSPNAVYIDGNKAYVAGTRSLSEAIHDWPKIATWHTNNIERYGQLTQALKDNPQVDTIIGHSLGASATAEVQRETNNKYMARYYGAPFLNINPFDGPDPRNQTFRHPGDPVSAFDHKAVDIRSNNFKTWWCFHGCDGYDENLLPKSYSNDFDFKEEHPSVGPKA